MSRDELSSPDEQTRRNRDEQRRARRRDTRLKQDPRLTETMEEKVMQTAKRIVMKETASGGYPYVEIYSTFDGGLATTDPREPRGY